MTAEDVLRRLYLSEKPVLQTNDWARLRIRVADLIAAICPPDDPADVLAALRSLRLDGRVMFLPDWERWGLKEDEKDGTLVPSRTHWEPALGNAEGMRPVVTFAYVTGWRINSEVLPLLWRQVDLRVGEVRLDPGTTKNREGRVFYLTPELHLLLKEQRSAADELQRQKTMIVQHVFFHRPVTRAGALGCLAGQRISECGFYQAWRRARTAAGCPGSIPHDFRRTAIRNMVRAGIPERVAMKLSGHKTRSVFDRYNVVSDGDLRDAASRLGHTGGHTSPAVAALAQANSQNPSEIHIR